MSDAGTMHELIALLDRPAPAVLGVRVEEGHGPVAVTAPRPEAGMRTRAGALHREVWRHRVYEALMREATVLPVHPGTPMTGPAIADAVRQNAEAIRGALLAGAGQSQYQLVIGRAGAAEGDVAGIADRARLLLDEVCLDRIDVPGPDGGSLLASLLLVGAGAEPDLEHGLERIDDLAPDLAIRLVGPLPPTGFRMAVFDPFDEEDVVAAERLLGVRDPCSVAEVRTARRRILLDADAGVAPARAAAAERLLLHVARTGARTGAILRLRREGQADLGQGMPWAA